MVSTFTLPVARSFMESATCADFRMTMMAALPAGAEVLQAKWLYGETGSDVDWLRVVAVTR